MALSPPPSPLIATFRHRRWHIFHRRLAFRASEKDFVSTTNCFFRRRANPLIGNTLGTSGSLQTRMQISSPICWTCRQLSYCMSLWSNRLISLSNLAESKWTWRCMELKIDRYFDGDCTPRTLKGDVFLVCNCRRMRMFRGCLDLPHRSRWFHFMEQRRTRRKRRHD